MAQEESPTDKNVNTTTDNELDSTTEELKADNSESVEGSDTTEDKSELVAKLEALEQELKDQQESVLRAKAEAQNIQRRAQRDVEHAHKFGLEKFTQELLPIVDNLERALDAAGEDPAVKPFREGVEMTMDLFVKALAKFEIEQIDPVGEPFDPQLHQAMSIVENSEMEANSVVAVMQRGYTLSGRLVRPAMVVVSKAPADASPKLMSRLEN